MKYYRTGELQSWCQFSDLFDFESFQYTSILIDVA